MTRAIILIFVLSAIVAFPKTKIYKLKILTTSGATKVGYLRAFTDSTLLISPEPILESVTEAISFREIASMRYKAKHASRKGLWIGFGIGAVLGAVIGYASYEPANCGCFDLGPEVDAAGGAVIGIASGTLIGLALGSSYQKMVVNWKSAQPDFIKTKVGMLLLRIK